MYHQSFTKQTVFLCGMLVWGHMCRLQVPGSGAILARGCRLAAIRCVHQVAEYPGAYSHSHCCKPSPVLSIHVVVLFLCYKKSDAPWRLVCCWYISKWKFLDIFWKRWKSLKNVLSIPCFFFFPSPVDCMPPSSWHNMLAWFIIIIAPAYSCLARKDGC